MISMELASGSNPNKKGKRTKFIHGYILSVCSRPELPQAPNAYTLRAMWQEPSSYQLCLNCRWNDTLEPGQPRPKPIPSWFYILSPRAATGTKFNQASHVFTTAGRAPRQCAPPI
eukprot:TRINITY_DN3560_c0_g1_i13.p1 TRINITY_DN3560_c0_g1~~TRINITY_DN3560_c0_g1_i13.p1  ORF type:complete len:115 (+),score=3.50 TRINITY_DN3560_c0_g1_i13:1371-1715(+)